MDEIVRLERTTCWCGTPFALPARLLESARNAAHTIYCPHGHSVVWQETETDRLRRERNSLKQQAAMLTDEARIARERAETAEASVKRLKKRVSAGTCPCCKRTFSNMTRHMKQKHPHFAAGAENVVPIKKPA